MGRKPFTLEEKIESWKKRTSEFLKNIGSDVKKLSEDKKLAKKLEKLTIQGIDLNLIDELSLDDIDNLDKLEKIIGNSCKKDRNSGVGYFDFGTCGIELDEVDSFEDADTIDEEDTKRIEIQYGSNPFSINLNHNELVDFAKASLIEISKGLVESIGDGDSESSEHLEVILDAIHTLNSILFKIPEKD